MFEGEETIDLEESFSSLPLRRRWNDGVILVTTGKVILSLEFRRGGENVTWLTKGRVENKTCETTGWGKNVTRVTTEGCKDVAWVSTGGWRYFSHLIGETEEDIFMYLFSTWKRWWFHFKVQCGGRNDANSRWGGEEMWCRLKSTTVEEMYRLIIRESVCLVTFATGKKCVAW